MLRCLPWLISLLIAVFDQFTKTYISRSLSLGQSIPLLKNIFHISLVHNSGAAFGLFKNQKAFFVILSLTVILFIVCDFIFNGHRHTVNKAIGSGLVLGGACGNLLDRLRLGYIVDFLDFRVWPVFNIADSAITVGIILLGIEVCCKGKR